MAASSRAKRSAQRGGDGGGGGKGGSPSPSKARKILHDGKVHGKPLTKRQRGFMGARARGK